MIIYYSIVNFNDIRCQTNTPSKLSTLGAIIEITFFLRGETKETRHKEVRMSTCPLGKRYAHACLMTNIFFNFFYNSKV